MIQVHRRRVRAVLALVVLAALVATPLQAFAAKGTTLSGVSEALTPLIGAGQQLAFRVSLTNSGTSAITQLRFDGTVSGAANFDATYAPECTFVGTTVSCVRGSNLPSGATQEWLLVFWAPASAGTVSLTNAAFAGDAKNGTPGAKQDVWAVQHQTTTVLSSSTVDFFSQLRLDGSGGGTPAIGTVQQSQILQIPEQGKAYGVSLRHTDARVRCGNRNYFGDTVELNVANGQSPVVVQITFGAISGLTPDKARVVHEGANGCYVPPICAASLENCQVTQWIGSGANRRVQVTVYLPSNGSIKGFRT